LVIERMARDRAAGRAFAYVITQTVTRAVIGLALVRQLDPAFEAAECECTIAPSSRGSSVFLETARLIGSFTFGSVGTHRLEARVLLRNGRANGALRKLGAVQEGVLRRSVRQAGDYLDQVLWSMLKKTGANIGFRSDRASTRHPVTLMNQLPVAARIYVISVIVMASRCSWCRCRSRHSRAAAVRGAPRDVVGDRRAQGSPAAHHQRLDDVRCHAVDFASLLLLGRTRPCSSPRAARSASAA
jgi:hypothetical protein